MPIPVLEKTWQFALNLQNTTDGIPVHDIRKAFILLKNALKAMPLSPWTVAGSSNGVTSNMTGTDLLVTFANIVGGDVPPYDHSWIVLRQPGLNGGAQVLFEFRSWYAPSDSGIDVVFSPSAGFTGGTTIVRPTASDEVVVTLYNVGNAPADWISPGGALVSRQYVIHVMQSTDGQCTRILGCAGGGITCYLAFEAPGSAVSGWANPVIAAMTHSSGALTLSASRWLNYADRVSTNMGYLGTGCFYALGNSGAPMYPTLGTEAHSGGTLVVSGDYANELSGEYPLTSLGVHNVTWFGAGVAAPGDRGRRGHLVDMWLTVPSLSTGDHLPGDGSKRFIVVDDFVLPWDGATTMLLGV